jgi:hypothetical protein
VDAEGRRQGLDRPAEARVEADVELAPVRRERGAPPARVERGGDVAVAGLPAEEPRGGRGLGERERGAGAVEVAPTPFWLLFAGPSARRAELESGSGHGAPKPLAITPPPVAAPAGGLRGVLGLVPTVVVAGGMTVVTGLALFVLLRMGLLSGL